MKTPRAEQIYRQRVARIVAFLVAHPLVEHRLKDLAAMAHFSPYHFHRIYRSVAGETVSATVRRIRLALATRLLEQGSHSITQVARKLAMKVRSRSRGPLDNLPGSRQATFRRNFIVSATTLIRRHAFPAPPSPDPRIKAAVIVDPLSFFDTDGLRQITVPIQLWASAIRNSTL